MAAYSITRRSHHCSVDGIEAISSVALFESRELLFLYSDECEVIKATGLGQ